MSLQKFSVKFFAPCCYSTVSLTQRAGGPNQAASDGIVFGKSPKWHSDVSATTHIGATPIIICDGSGCSSCCFGSRALGSARPPLTVLGAPGGQKGMYRSQGEEEKYELMPKGRL